MLWQCVAMLLNGEMLMKSEMPLRTSKMPPPSYPAESNEQRNTIRDKDQLHALLYEALETEQGGVLVYETALQCAINPELIKEWSKYLAQTKNHVVVLTNVLKQFGLNPDQETPGRN